MSNDIFSAQSSSDNFSSNEPLVLGDYMEKEETDESSYDMTIEEDLWMMVNTEKSIPKEDIQLSCLSETPRKQQVTWKEPISEVMYFSKV